MSSTRRIFSAAGWIAGHAMLVAIVLFGIWIEVLQKYHVSGFGISDDEAQALIAMTDHERLEHIGDLLKPIGLGLSFPSGLAKVSALRSGMLEVDGQSPVQIGREFTPGQLQAGLPTVQLAYASLITIDYSLRAYAESSDLTHLEDAAAFLTAFANFERQQVLPVGFLWNDHAIAARAGAVLRFLAAWSRAFPQRADVATLAIRHLERCMLMLAKPQQFTAWTNHGVMQNVALLGIIAGFPGLANAIHGRELVEERLGLQLPYYLSDEGVILEHSPEYHLVGLDLLGAILALRDLVPIALPADILTRYERGHSLAAAMRRPDCTLPPLGDTQRTPYQPYSPVASLVPDMRNTACERASPSRLELAPLSGFALIWRDADDSAAHVSMTWSHFPGQGHNVANDLSVVVWRNGASLGGGVGYWPYGTRGRLEAEGWKGSNGPHCEGESPAVERQSALVSHGAGDGFVWIEAGRSNKSGGRIVRSLLVSPEGEVFVVDQATGIPDCRLSSVWLTDRGYDVRGIDAQTVLLRRSARETDTVSWRASPGVALTIDHWNGSSAPFSGWIAFDGRPVPVPAIGLQTAAASSPGYAVALNHADTGARTFLPVIDNFVLGSAAQADSGWNETWRAGWSTGRRNITIDRQKDFVVLSGRDDGSITRIPLVQVHTDEMDARRNRILESVRKAHDHYPRVRDHFEHRLKLTSWLLWAALPYAFFVFFQTLRAPTASRYVFALAALPALTLSGYFWGIHFAA